MGIFIQISVNQDRLSPDIARQLVRVCPVDIYALDGDNLVVRADQEDECTLCELCLQTAPAGALAILKTYKGETLVSRGLDQP
jgi:NAD-dependent dihydropyrimidine dehydrogenase PreA subunit